MVLSHTPTGLTAHEDVGIGRGANMTSLEFTQSQGGERPSIRMEITVPEIVLPIPTKQPRVLSHIAIRGLITTNPPIPLKFRESAGLLPELLAPDGQALQPQRVPFWPVEERQLCIARYTGAMSFTVFSTLAWNSNKLQLSLIESVGDSNWYFDDLKPGTYQLRFTYQNCGEEVSCLTLPVTREGRTAEEFEVGKCATQFVNLRLVQP